MKVIVEKDGLRIWERTESPPSGRMRRDDAELLSVIAALEESVMQAKANLSTVDAYAVSDIGLTAFTNVEGDIPVVRAGGCDPDGKVGIESPEVPIRPTSLETLEVGIVGQHDVALGVGVDDHNVAVVEVFSGVDELHGSVGVGSEISLSNVKEHAPPLAGASVRRGVRVVVTEDHVNRAASGGCCVSSC